MLRLGLLFAGLVGALLAPAPVQVRFSMSVQPGLQVDAAAARRALERGLFADTLIRPYTTGEIDSLLARGQRAYRDSLPPQPSPTIVLVRARLTGTGSSVSVCLVALSLLAQPLAGPDTVTSSLAALDSVLASYGARYAQVLANRRWARGSSNGRCGI